LIPGVIREETVMQQRSRYGQPSGDQRSRWAWLDVGRRALTKPHGTEVTTGWSLRRAIEFLDDAVDAMGAQFARGPSVGWSGDATSESICPQISAIEIRTSESSGSFPGREEH
jgi:hypothetical protein